MRTGKQSATNLWNRKGTATQLSQEAQNMATRPEIDRQALGSEHLSAFWGTTQEHQKQGPVLNKAGAPTKPPIQSVPSTVQAADDGKASPPTKLVRQSTSKDTTTRQQSNAQKRDQRQNATLATATRNNSSKVVK